MYITGGLTSNPVCVENAFAFMKETNVPRQL